MKYSSWKIPYSRPGPPAALLKAGYSPLLAAVLTLRGIHDPKSAAGFLRAGLGEPQNPFELQDMHAAVQRIKCAREAGERTAVYGDYDVDGITATCLLGDYLISAGFDCELYIPDRIEEGYGLNAGAIDLLFSRGVTLIITVDCGVTAIKEIEYAGGLGIDIIVTDHHECPEKLPCAAAVVDPKRPDSGGFKHLAGVGVAFMLVSALMGDSVAALERYADLTALGTIADVMPMTGENRRIISAGLLMLRDNPRPGLKALIDETGSSGGKLTAMTVGYNLAPRINAAGRLGTPERAMRLLMSGGGEESASLARELCELNRARQRLETVIWEQAQTLLEAASEGPIVLASESWHQGVIGIVASRVAETRRAPAVLICLEGEIGKGSCRSFGGFDMFAALSSCAYLLEDFGGHTLAAGLTVRREKLGEFIAAFSEYYLENPPGRENALSIELLADSPELLSMNSVSSLNALEPCGAGNPRPLLCLTGARLESVVPMGGGKHLKLRVSKFGQIYDCVCFSRTQSELALLPGERADIAFFPQINEFKTRKTVQLLVEDIRPEDDCELCLAVLRGEMVMTSCLERHRPDRGSLARVWRALRAYGGTLSAAVPEALSLAGEDGGKVRAALCLAVLNELGLITLKLDGNNMEITANLAAERVELESSAIFRGQ